MCRRLLGQAPSAGPASLEDLGSKNGTWVGDVRIDGPIELADGDAFRLGSVRITLRLRPADLATATAASGHDRD